MKILRQLWSTKACGDVVVSKDCERALSFSYFLLLLRESGAQDLQPQLLTMHGLYLVLCPTTIPDTPSLPTHHLSAWASYPAHRAKKEGGEERQ